MSKVLRALATLSPPNKDGTRLTHPGSKQAVKQGQGKTLNKALHTQATVLLTIAPCAYYYMSNLCVMDLDAQNSRLNNPLSFPIGHLCVPEPCYIIYDACHLSVKVQAILFGTMIIVQMPS